MDIGHWLEPGAIALRLGADSKRQALAALAEVAGRALRQPPGDVLDRLLEREAEGSTGVGNGVAVPHARLPGLAGLKAVFVRLETPVAFEAVDSRPVDLMLALFAPEGSGVEHLRALAKAARALRGAELREQLRKARTTDAIYALLSQESSTSAA
ncbi:PTS sugar transporter subunit IIA [Caulobacter sp. S45]|uniref:PTS sugar transporter subunit IIA n=1 Tax=Caulobacter sp. S45 TaxID=1641861 RepID=UPI001575C260|nr:PTS sugar transporter subunit IIA [Caulobacter sp. S45]